MSENTPQDPQPEGDAVLSAATLRTMDEKSDRLAADVDDARAAVHAAREADSMSPPGQEDFGAVDNAPTHGDGPVDPHDEDEPEA
jgi:hypothetical protein